MSPPFIPPMGGNDEKAVAVPAVSQGDGCLAISGRAVWKEAMSSYPTCFFLIFSYLMICGGSKAT